MKKLTTDLHYGFFAIIWYIIFVLQFATEKYTKINIKTVMMPLFCRGVMLGFPHCEGGGS
jgi:hypothetical protein